MTMQTPQSTVNLFLKAVAKHGLATVIVTVLLSLASLVGYQWTQIKLDEQRLTMKSCLSPDATYLLTEGSVWYHSEGKLKELKGIMINNHIHEYPNETKLKIKNLLQRRTSVYVQILNSMNSPIPRLGDWWTANFQFDPFLDEINDIVFRDMDFIDENHRQLLINEKTDQIRQKMFEYQSATNALLYSALNQTNGTCL